MHFLTLLATAALVSTSASAANIPSSRKEAREAYSRSNVDNCEAALRWHRASAFCSSFANIKDVKTTVYKNSPTTTVTTTKTAACTTGPKSYAYAKRDASAKAYYQQQCNRRGVPTYAQKYCCEDINKACRKYVRSRTTTITISNKQCTATQTKWITPACTASTTGNITPTTTAKLVTTTSSAQTSNSRTTTATASSTSLKDTTQSTVTTTATTASTTQTTTTTSESTTSTTSATTTTTTAPAGPTCAANQMACGSSCLDTSRDDNNCGSCGNKCAYGTACVGSVCSCTPNGQFVGNGNKLVPCCNGSGMGTMGVCL